MSEGRKFTHRILTENFPYLQKCKYPGTKAYTSPIRSNSIKSTPKLIKPSWVRDKEKILKTPIEEKKVTKRVFQFT
jgi:hypothetical protein